MTRARSAAWRPPSPTGVQAIEEARRLEADTAAELTGAERELSAWQAEWDDFNARASAGERELTLEADRADRLEQGLATLRRRLEELASEPGVPVDESDTEALDAALVAAEERHEGAEAALEACIGELSAVREELEAGARAVDAARREVQRLENETTALRAVQEAALGRANGGGRSLAGGPRAARTRRGSARASGRGGGRKNGWETAVEAVLGAHLQAVRVDDTAPFAGALGELEGGRVTLYEGAPLPTPERTLPSLASLAHTEHGPVGALLAGIFAADSLEAALAARADLAPGESVVTRDGLWMGRDWIRLDRGEDATAGIVERGVELETLGRALAEARARLAAAEEARSGIAERADALENERERSQAACRQSGEALAALRAERDVLRVRIDEARAGRQRVERDRDRARADLAADTARLAAARSRIDELSGAAAALQAERHERGALRERLMARVETARRDASAAREDMHERNPGTRAADDRAGRGAGRPGAPARAADRVRRARQDPGGEHRGERARAAGAGTHPRGPARRARDRRAGTGQRTTQTRGGRTRHRRPDDPAQRGGGRGRCGPGPGPRRGGSP